MAITNYRFIDELSVSDPLYFDKFDVDPDAVPDQDPSKFQIFFSEFFSVKGI